MDNRNNEAALKWAIKKLVIMHFSPTIFGPCLSLGLAINQTSFSSIGLNNVDTTEITYKKNTVAFAKRTISREKTITVESNIKNEGKRELKRRVNSIIENEKAGELNKDAKLGFKVQSKKYLKVGFKVQPITVGASRISY